MKNLRHLLPALALLCYGSAAQAQTAPMAKTGEMAQPEHDHMMMHDGKMTMMHDGQPSPMTKTMTLRNGTKVMADGTVLLKNGKKTMLKEGQEIGTDGKMHADKMHEGKM